MAERNLEHMALNLHEQEQSSLFSLPGEIRDLIYRFALAEYEDPDEMYSANTFYARPGYFARGRTDTTLLTTCRKVYLEAWFLPWTLREHTFFFTRNERKPERHSTHKEMTAALAAINEAHGEKATELNHVRLFAQLFLIENGNNLNRLLSIPYFNVITFTICLRSHDFWNWEIDGK